MLVNKAKQRAAKILNVGVDRVWINPKEIAAVREAITNDDLRELIKKGIIKKRKAKFQSRAHARMLKEKKKKGRKKGKGKRKASKNVRMHKREAWINRVRALRRTLKELKEKQPQVIESIGYAKLYSMIKGNYFKGKNYLIRFVEENKAVKK